MQRSLFSVIIVITVIKYSYSLLSDQLVQTSCIVHYHDQLSHQTQSCIHLQPYLQQEGTSDERVSGVLVTVGKRLPSHTLV